MTEPKDDAPDATEDESARDASQAPDPAQPVDVPLPDETALGSDPDAARAEAEAAALAANEVDAEEAPETDEAALETDADIGEDSLEDRGGADDEASDAAGAELVGAGVPAAAGASAAERRTGRAAREARAAAANAAIPVDPAIRVRDNASKLFVIGTILVFALIFLNGMLLGTGGVFRPYVSPPPESSASESIEPSASVAPSGSVGVSGSPAASGSVGASSSLAPSPLGTGSPGPS